MDAVVVGAGPAGCAAAIPLAQAGWRVLVFGRAPVGNNRIGESLSPAAPALLERLGLPRLLAEPGHLVCHANASAWGSESIAWHDFLGDARGPSFHIDRARFEARLRERAAEAGAQWVDGEAPRADAHDAGFRLGASAAGPSLVTRYVIDASGRASSFARAQGGRRRAAWEQVALVAFARSSVPIQETFSLVEAVPEGFWYSAPLADGRFALALFTDAGLHDARASRSDEGFGALLRAATHTHRRLEGHGATIAPGARFVDAGCARLDRAHGRSWIAAGDAALTYDPISAHGLTLALRTGIDAASAVLADARGEADAFERYGARLDHAFTACCHEALRIYGAERRWPHASYWRRRSPGGPLALALTPPTAAFAPDDPPHRSGFTSGEVAGQWREQR